MSFSSLKPALFATANIVTPFAVVIALATAIAPIEASAPHGVWIDGQGGSCDLVCRAQGREAFRTGHYHIGNQLGGPQYTRTERHFTICRAPLSAQPSLASRPGFQEQTGSPNVCKIQSFDAQRHFDCLCN